MRKPSPQLLSDVLNTLGTKTVQFIAQNVDRVEFRKPEFMATTPFAILPSAQGGTIRKLTQAQFDAMQRLGLLVAEDTGMRLTPLGKRCIKEVA